MRHLIAILIFTFTSVLAAAQQRAYTAFTVNDGLPSNLVYQCLEDNKGFLWVATDGGIARFDGKYFQLFTTANGLPDNEVLNIAKEINGRIWVNCHRQSPAYFDEEKNRFINSTENKELAKVSGTVNMTLFALPEGGMQFNNEIGSFVFKNTKLDTLASLLGKRYFRVRNITKDIQIGVGGSLTNTKRNTIFYLLNEKNIKDSLIFEEPREYNFYRFINNNKYYNFNSSSGNCYIYSVTQNNPFKATVESIKNSEPFSNFGFNDTTIFFVGISGRIQVYHKNNLQYLYSILGDYLANRLYEDSKGNIWISSVDKGLLVYRSQNIAPIQIPSNYNRKNFLSIAKIKNAILAGNYYGEVIESEHERFIVHSVIKKKPSRQRKIVVAGKDIYTVSDDGVHVNYLTSFLNPNNQLPMGGKTALLYNDTTLLVGSFAGVLHINPRNKKVTASVRFKRGMALAIGNDGLVYYGSTDGLYTYNVHKQLFESIKHIHPLVDQRIVAITVTEDGLVWVATANGTLVIIKNKKVIQILDERSGLVSSLFRTITIGKKGQVWVGTAQGISVINYINSQRGKINYTIQNLTKNDGLTSNEVNEMILDKDTIYAATSNGISIIPTSINTRKVEILVQLIKISVNQKDTSINGFYKLNSNTQNIQMQFAGINLNGYFKKFQYRISKKQVWLDIIGTTLTLQLGSGKHILEVRAVEANGYASKLVKTIQFEIETPFWKSVWFWILTAIVLQLIIIFTISKWQKKRKEQQMAIKVATVQTAALEQQAFTSLMNPHFMFNALNSIQHYINVQDKINANRYLSDFASLLRKSFEAAQRSFIPLEEELEHIKVYLRLEQMRFSDRFKYEILIADDIDLEDWMIPTMMLQPLLENALLHGIMPSSIPGELSINLKVTNKNLKITIIDNGIGIKNSETIQEQSQHKSHGRDLIQKRIAALFYFGNQPITLITTSAFKSVTNPGVKIILTIPLDLYGAWLKAQQNN